MWTKKQDGAVRRSLPVQILKSNDTRSLREWLSRWHQFAPRNANGFTEVSLGFDRTDIDGLWVIYVKIYHPLENRVACKGYVVASDLSAIND